MALRHDQISEIEPFRSFGKRGESFDSVGGIALDENLNLYITDLGNTRIVIYTYDGDYLTTLEHSFITSLHSIAISDHCVVVTQLGRGNILKFETEYGPRVSQNKFGTMRFPSGVKIDENGDIFVADCSNNRVAVFENNLELKMCFGCGKLRNPRDVVLQSDRVYVSDSSKDCHIHVFTKSGELLKSFIARDATGNLYFCVNNSSSTIILSNANRCEIVCYTMEGELALHLFTRGRPTGCVLALNNIFICADYDISCINFYNLNNII